ncbi:MAG: flagellar export protein FliJ [Armatimonadetes bacterium]|nr:flagellar export protein FliJ [Armatimonadota bacterium]
MDRARADRLVALRTAREDALKRELAAAQQRIARARSRQEALCAELERCRTSGPETGATGRELMRIEAYAERLREEIQRQQYELDRAEEQLTRAQEALTAASQERMAAEALLDREEDALTARRNAVEQIELDDTAASSSRGEDS